MKKYDNKSLLIGSIIGTLIASTPYLFYLHLSVPQQRVWHTFLFTYDSKGWGDANVAMWVFTGKVVPLLLLLLWFFTNRHWWYHTLLVPIAMYVYQIFDFFNSTLSYVDEFQLIYLIPIMVVVIPTIYLIRARIFNKVNETTKSLQELEDEFKLSPKSFWDKVKQYF
ncbi:hypothetical protein EM932_04025 [Flavivirga rizhaonensis]|uniref:Uncharacterized protein n=1 Tax=Flavivirga rizhaonensis TaxID=2559571 RepID=A0A4S1E162_9FLAO|nr:hypothetical protein EM932_04025 [Flavivirga rizhaonensis]